MKHLIAILFSIFIIPGCNLLEIPSDMFTLDKSYIGIWLPAQQDQYKEVKAALPAFQDQWIFFKEKYKGLLKTEDEMETARRLDKWIDDAVICLAQKDGVCVRVKLDQFKYELQEIRSYWESDYYLDYLWDFEENIYQFVAVATDQKLDLLQWNEFMPYLRAVNVTYERLKEKELDPEFFDFDQRRVKAYEALLDEVSTRVDCLNGLSEAAQLEEIAQCATGIQQLVYEMIALFGNIDYSSETTF